MITLFALTVKYTGKAFVLDYTIPPEAHGLGVTGREWKRVVRLSEQYLETEGAGLIEDEMQMVVARLDSELRGAWEQYPLY